MFQKVFTLSMLLAICFVLSGADEFSDECLRAHNNYRAIHQAPPMTLDSQVQKAAQKWADYLANNDKFEHSQGSGYGENIYGSFGNINISGSVPVKAWYDEVKSYNYNKPGFSSSTGHFTQVVWKSSIRLGCAIATKGTTAIVVANYSPPGNYLGQFAENVLPPV